MNNIAWDFVIPLEDENLIEEFEKQYYISLPNDLKRCIIQNNAGSPNKRIFYTSQNKGRIFNSLLSFKESDEAESVFEITSDIQSEYPFLIPFARDPFGNYICLQNNKIILWKHETNTIEYIADSFTDLISKLHEETMIDLTQIIIEAFSKRFTWSKTIALDVAFHFKEHNQSIVIDFDGEAGENWISFVVNKMTVGYLHIGMPLFFHQNKYVFNDDTNLLKIVEVDDFKSESYALNTEVFQEVFHTQPNEIISLESFSIDMLWYMTIT